MKKKLTAILLVIMVIISAAGSGILFGGEKALTVSKFTAVLEDAGFVSEDKFKEAYYGGRFVTDEDMYRQLCEDGIKGTLSPDAAVPEHPGIAEYAAYELSEFYVDGGSIFFPYGDRMAYIIFGDSAAASDFYKQTAEALLLSLEDTAHQPDTLEDDDRSRLRVSTGNGISLVSRKGRTVLVFSGGGACALKVLEKLGY